MDATTPAPAIRRRGGRPRKAEARLIPVRYRATEAEFADLEARARSSGQSLSEVVRAAVHAGGRRPPARSAPGRDAAPVVAQLGRLGNILNQCVRLAQFGTFPLSVAAEAEDALHALGLYLRKLAAADDPEA
jgi:Mobilization protein NikA